MIPSLQATEAMVQFTEHLFGPTKTEAQWRAEHASCLAIDEQFTREFSGICPPSGPWDWLICVCGAKHLCDGGGEGAHERAKGYRVS